MDVDNIPAPLNNNMHRCQTTPEQSSKLVLMLQYKVCVETMMTQL